MTIILGKAVDRTHYEYEHRVTPVKVATHPSTIRLIAYWQQCEERGGLRMGRDIPARAIAALLKDLTVAEPVNDWADARIRLAGSGMAVHFGRDVSGALMSEIAGGAESDWRMLLAGAKSVIAHNRPGTIQQIILDDGREIQRQELTALPILAPDSDARWVLTGTFDF
jgi:hypothetical protein